MAEFKKPKWLRDLNRLLGVHRQFVLEGNIRDVVCLPTRSGFGLVSMKLALQRELFAANYPVVLYWNPISGLDIFPATETAVRNAAKITPDSLKNRLEQVADQLKSLADKPDNSASRPTELCSGIELMSLTLLRELIQRMARNHPGDPPCALIVDYASRIASSPNALPKDELEFFRTCEQASNDAQPRTVKDGTSQQYNPLIWLCNRAQDLPSWLLLDSPNIYTISCAPPDLDTRQTVAKYHLVKTFGEKADVDTTARVLATQTEGLRLAVVGEIVLLARDAAITVDDAVRSHQIGDLIKESPWRSTSLRAHIRDAAKGNFFENRVKGQPLAITNVMDMLKRSIFGLTGAHTRSSQARPKGIMFFAGPTGVGKTEMAKAVAKLIFDNDHALLRFDMSEFSQEHSEARLIGAPPGYVGYEVGGELTNAIRERPYQVILFDEIEKAHPRILDKFLQILEDGRLTDGRGDTVYFSESIIIFTSNLGIFVDDLDDIRVQKVKRIPNVKPGDPYDEVQKKVKDAILDHFRFKLNRPEILNRIGLGNIVVFNFIEKEAAIQIFANNLSSVLQKLKDEINISVTLDEKAKEYLETLCTSNLENGGRGIGAMLETAFTNSLTRALFDNDALAGSSWRVTKLGTTTNGAYCVELDSV